MKGCKLANNIEGEGSWDKDKAELLGNGPWTKTGKNGKFYIHWCETHQQFSVQCGYDNLVGLMKEISKVIESQEKDNRIKDIIESYFGDIEGSRYWGIK